MNVTVARLLGSQDDKLPKAVIVARYVLGMDLVSKKKLQELPTQMRNLHKWYLRVVKQDRKMIIAKVPQKYYFQPEQIHVEFEGFRGIVNQNFLRMRTEGKPRS